MPSWGGGSVHFARCFSQLIQVSWSTASTFVLRHFSAPRFLRFSRRLISRSVPLRRFHAGIVPEPERVEVRAPLDLAEVDVP